MSEIINGAGDGGELWQIKRERLIGLRLVVLTARFLLRVGENGKYLKYQRAGSWLNGFGFKHRTRPITLKL